MTATGQGRRRSKCFTFIRLRLFLAKIAIFLLFLPESSKKVIFGQTYLQFYNPKYICNIYKVRSGKNNWM